MGQGAVGGRNPGLRALGDAYARLYRRAKGIERHGALNPCTPRARTARIMRRGCGGFFLGAATRPVPTTRSGASLRAIRLAQSPGWASDTEQKTARSVARSGGDSEAGWRARRRRLLSTAATAAGQLASAAQQAWMPAASCVSPWRMCTAWASVRRLVRLSRTAAAEQPGAAASMSGSRANRAACSNQGGRSAMTAPASEGGAAAARDSASAMSAGASHGCRRASSSLCSDWTEEAAHNSSGPPRSATTGGRQNTVRGRVSVWSKGFGASRQVGGSKVSCRRCAFPSAEGVQQAERRMPHLRVRLRELPQRQQQDRSALGVGQLSLERRGGGVRGKAFAVDNGREGPAGRGAGGIDTRGDADGAGGEGEEVRVGAGRGGQSECRRRCWRGHRTSGGRPREPAGTRCAGQAGRPTPVLPPQPTASSAAPAQRRAPPPALAHSAGPCGPEGHGPRPRWRGWRTGRPPAPRWPGRAAPPPPLAPAPPAAAGQTERAPAAGWPHGESPRQRPRRPRPPASAPGRPARLVAAASRADGARTWRAAVGRGCAEARPARLLVCAAGKQPTPDGWAGATRRGGWRRRAGSRAARAQRRPAPPAAPRTQPARPATPAAPIEAPATVRRTACARARRSRRLRWRLGPSLRRRQGRAGARAALTAPGGARAARAAGPAPALPRRGPPRNSTEAGGTRSAAEARRPSRRKWCYPAAGRPDGRAADAA
eukprot:scaffold988_cov105-Isochrysis_galbana.AAC.4